jgi:hypothetical protein
MLDAKPLVGGSNPSRGVLEPNISPLSDRSGSGEIVYHQQLFLKNRQEQENA